MRRALALVALFAATSLHAATDALTVGSVTAPAGTISVPLFVRDAGTTALGVDKGSGLRIQGVAFKVTFSQAVTSVTFTRAGVLLKTPLFETTLPVTNGLGYVASFAESNNALPFATNAAAPGQLIGYLAVTTNAAAGTVIDISIDPANTTLSNQAGTMLESFANATLSLQDGSITVSPCPAFNSATISIDGRAGACDAGTGGTASVAVSGGSSPTYQWGWRSSPGGTTNPILGATGGSYVINGADFGGTGARYLVVTATSSCSQVTSSPVEVTIGPPNVSLVASTGVYANSAENYASVANATPGASFNWSLTNGTITSGQGTSKIRYTAGASGTVGIDVAVTGLDCGGSASPHADVTVMPQPAGASLLYLLTPCRVIDTRESFPIANGQDRAVTVAGACGVSAGAKAVTANITVIAPPTDGWLAAFPSDLPWPGTSTISYRANRTRANNAVIPLSSDGRVTLKNSGSTLHFIIDVTGYFK